VGVHADGRLADDADLDAPAQGQDAQLFQLFQLFQRFGRQRRQSEQEGAAVARVLDHLQGYREELTTLMTERFHLVPEAAAETAPAWGS
jgi:hypothetical protein